MTCAGENYGDKYTNINTISNSNLESSENNSKPFKGNPYETLVFILFYLLATAAAIPENFVITASDYWNYKFRNVSEGERVNATNKTKLQTEFYSTFNTAGSSTTVVSLLLAIWIGIYVSIHKRMVTSIVVMLTFFVMILTFTQVDTDSWQSDFYIVSIILGALLRAAGNCCTIPVFQLAMKFPTKYFAAQIAGRSVCGIFAALTQVLAIAMTNNSKLSGTIYFTIGTAIILVTFILYAVVSQISSFFKERYAYEPPKTNSPAFSKTDFVNAFKKLWGLLIASAIITGSTSMLHPGVTSLITSVNPGSPWSDVYFVPVTCYLFMNLFDFVGREVGRIFLLDINPIIVLIVSIVRLVIFNPLIMFSNIQPRYNIPVGIESDTAFMVIMILFAFTNGYFANWCILKLPELVSPQEVKWAYVLYGISMLLSMAVFAYFSIVIVNFI